MAKKRLLIEVGEGVDESGDDINAAVVEAVREAESNCWMPELEDIFDIDLSREKLSVRADVYAPEPEDVDPDVVKQYLKQYDVKVHTHRGGANPEGLHTDGPKDKNTILMAIVALTIYIDV